jgi:anti-anti-sigma regulatory factor
MSVAVDAVPRRFSIVLSQAGGARCQVQVSGELDEATAAPLACVLRDVRAESSGVDLDLGGVTAAELPGMLPLWDACLDAAGPRLRIVAASPAVRSLVDVVLQLVAGDGDTLPDRVSRRRLNRPAPAGRASLSGG